MQGTKLGETHSQTLYLGQTAVKSYWRPIIFRLELVHFGSFKQYGTT